MERKFRHLDLFSGIGGFALAASWVWGSAHQVVSFCEIDLFAQKVLKKHWPDTPIHDDIKSMNGEQYGRIDILTGGFPCQPYSFAGERRGSKDDRALWPEMRRIIKESKPRWIIGENVAGFVSMDLDKTLSDLETEGYETATLIIPALAVKTEHKRERVWVIANAGLNGFQEIFMQPGTNDPESKKNVIAPGCFRGPGLQISKRILWESNPGILRVGDGIPDRMDRIRALGNAIVPQLVANIMQAIKQIESVKRE